MARQRTSTKVTRIIDITPEEIEMILKRHFTNGIGDVEFVVTSGGGFDGAVLISTTEESNKTETIS